MTNGGKEVVVRVPYIDYPVWFQEKQVRALLDSSSKVNAMNPTYAKRLGLKTQKANVGAQKIDGSSLETFRMVIANFQIEDKSGKPRFFQKTFLVADTKFEVILGILFLKINNANVAFDEGTLTWKSYTTNKALPTTERVRLINPKEFVIAALDADSETFVVHVAIWEQEEMPVHTEKQAQVGALLFDEAPIKIPVEYFDYSDLFLAENAAKHPEKTGMNEHTIELEESNQPLLGPIYSLGPVELETLKTYIETNLANKSLCLCVNYQDFNNITIKNWYPLPFVGESLDRLSWARRFTQLDFTNAYH